jgi:hypothetical protein
MKKSKDKDQPVTIGDFQDFADFVINTAATKDDLKLIKDDLKHIKKELTTGDAIRKIVKEEVRPMKEELEDKITEFKDAILKSDDKLVKKLDHFLTEQAMLGGIQSRHETDIEKLKGRVTRLETKASIA